MNLADFQAANAPHVDNPLYRFAQMPTRVNFPQGGSTLGIASPRQQTEAQRIRQTVQDKVIAPAVNAVTDPFYAATPGMDQRRQDARRRILEKVTAVTTDPMAATFAGVGAKMADKAALAKSLEMKAAGIPDREIWKETGWTHAFPDGKPRFEISDNNMKMSELPLSPYAGAKPAAEYINHPELMAEPYLGKTLGDIPVAAGNMAGERAAYTRNPFGNNPDSLGVMTFNTEDFGTSGRASDALHELQHAMQEQEGFARGGSVSEFANPLRKQLQELDNEVTTINAKMKQASGTPEYNELMDKRSEIAKQIQEIQGPYGIGIQESADKQYRSLAGEVEARLTQRRMDLDAAQRRERYPISEMDVPPEQQIVRFGGGTAQSVAIPDGAITKVDYMGAGDMQPIIKNPTREQADSFFGHVVDFNEKRGVPYDKRDNIIRWIKDEQNGDIYMAPAHWVTHHDLADTLGVSKLDQGMVRNPNTFNYLLPE